MSDDWTGWDDEDFLERLPFGGRPVGGKPVGGKPVGGKPFVGMPVGGKPVGGKPVGGKPFRGRPVGGKPVGGKPVGGKLARDDHGHLGPDEWSAQVGALVCERSAVIRLGATIVATDDQLWIPEFESISGPRGVRFKGGTKPPALLTLTPRANVLEAMVAVPDSLVDQVVEDPDVGDPVKVDLGEGLGREADKVFLASVGNNGSPVTPTGGLLKTLRGIVDKLFKADQAFRNPGWILHPDTLAEVFAIRTLDGKSPDTSAAGKNLTSLGLLRLVSAAEGTLLGLPFVTSAEATNATGKPRIYFGADWQEAYIGVDPSFVTVDVPGDPVVEEATVIRASMPVDFALRRAKSLFAFANAP